MTLNQLSEKVIPMLLVVMIVACGSAMIELRVLSEKVDMMQKAMMAYHEEE